MPGARQSYGRPAETRQIKTLQIVKMKGYPLKTIALFLFISLNWV